MLAARQFYDVAGLFGRFFSEASMRYCKHYPHPPQPLVGHCSFWTRSRRWPRGSPGWWEWVTTSGITQRARLPPLGVRCRTTPGRILGVIAACRQPSGVLVCWGHGGWWLPINTRPSDFVAWWVVLQLNYDSTLYHTKYSIYFAAQQPLPA